MKHESEKAVRLAVVIPMFNEEQGAARCVNVVCDTLRRELPTARLFVVNDGSVDETERILLQIERSEELLTVVSCRENRGYGAALLEGARVAREAGFEFGLFMDSDLTNDPSLIPIFYGVVQGGFDVVKASRYVKDGGMSGVPLHRQLVSRFGNRIASLLCGVGIRDCTNGFRAVRLSLLEGVTFTERGFPSIMEELYILKQRGARFAEVPYVLTSRAAGEKASSFRYNFRTFYRYLKYCVLARWAWRS